jgi:hypothetical protein
VVVASQKYSRAQKKDVRTIDYTNDGTVKFEAGDLRDVNTIGSPVLTASADGYNKT